MAISKYTGKKGVTYTIDYYENGKRIREKVGPNKKEAQELLGQRLKEIREGKHFGARSIRRVLFEDLCKEYKERNAHQRSQATMKYVVDLLKERFAGRYVHELTEKDVDDFIISRRDTPTRWQRARKGSTVNREAAMLRAMLSMAAAQRMATRNAASRPRTMPEPKGRLRYLSIEEATKPLELAKKSGSGDIYPLILLALDTGGRRGELVNLHWEDLDYAKGQVWIRRSKNGEPRYVPMTERARAVLKARPRRLGSPLVFNGNELGKPISNGIREVFVNLLEKAGIADFTFHDLRHTYASHLVMAGVPLYTVGKLLGHKTPHMTARYAHLAPEYLKQAVSSLPNWEGDGQETVRNGVGA